MGRMADDYLLVSGYCLGSFKLSAKVLHVPKLRLRDVVLCD